MHTKTIAFRGNSFQLAYNDVHASWWSFEDEKDVREALWDIKPGDLVLDVGCAYGSYTLCALAAGAAKVMAWTPDENEMSVLRESLILNGWENKCDTITSGIYGEDGWLEAFSQTFSKEPFTQQFPDPKQIFEVHPLTYWESMISSEFERVWMKLDVEGSELQILQGAQELIKKLKPNIFVENHEFKAHGIGQHVRDFMEQLGWTHIETRPYHSVSHSLYVP